jgi:hypothetical protein
VKNRFQSLPFKCNLQRYTMAAANAAAAHNLDELQVAAVGLRRLNQVDP